MGKILVIAEKPQAGKDIARILGCTQSGKGYMEGNGYIVTWAVGHLTGLKTPEEHDARYKQWRLEDLPLAFDIKDSLKVLPDTAGQYQTVKTLIQRPDIDMLINAGDAGREGYLIQSWIYRMAGNKKPVKVLWASSLTEEAIRKAFSNLKEDSLFCQLLQEAEARAEGDYLLGMNYSRAFTLTKASPGTSLSYGRCQTTLLNLLVKRDREIEQFQPVPYYTVEASYTKGFTGILINHEGKKINFLSADKAEEILSSCSGKTGIIKKYVTQDKSKKAPQLYNLSALQQDMGKRFAFSPDYTLQIAQKLYEEYKVLSYPRTDSRYLSMDIYREIGRHLSSCNFGLYSDFIEPVDISLHQADKSYYNDLKITDHHALIPTINSNMESAYKKMNEDEIKVFDAVVRRMIAIFLPPYRYQSSAVTVDMNGSLFLSKGTVIQDLGYRKVCKGDSDNENRPDNRLQMLPLLKPGDEITVERLKIIKEQTKAPLKYTVGSIIELMEHQNIGTSATRAEIIKKLLNPRRQFAVLDKGKYSSTELGRNYIDVIPDDLKDVSMTQHFEKRLAQISAGEITKQDFLQELDNQIREKIELLKKDTSEGNRISAGRQSAGKCPKCGAEVLPGKKNYYCAAYKSGCDFVIWRKTAGKEISETSVKQLLTKGITSELKGFTSAKGSHFDARLKLNEDMRVTFQFVNKNRRVKHEF